jgi:hypothetical protein
LSWLTGGCGELSFDQLRGIYNVADPGCLSLILIPDPKTAKKERSEKICCHTFLCSHKFHRIENYFIFEIMKKKFGAIFKEI